MFDSGNRLEVIARHLNTSTTRKTPADHNLTTNYVSSQVPATIYDNGNGKLQFTQNSHCLSFQQRLFYEENGFLVIPKLVNDACLDDYIQRFLQICNGDVKSTVMTVMKDISYAKMKLSERTVNKIQDFIFDDVLKQYCYLPEILDYVECFTGENIMAVHTMLINKPPDSGALTSRHPLHQDLHYFPFRPADRIVCSWTAMQMVNRENGCLVVIPGSHKGILRNHDYPQWEGKVNKLYHGVQDLSQEEMDSRVFLEMTKGDTIFFHPLLLHGSGSNRSNECRKSISCHYAASECNYIDVTDPGQKKLQNELSDYVVKRGMQMDDFSVIWKAKSVLVRGDAINL